MRTKYDCDGDTLDILPKEQRQIQHAVEQGQVRMNYDEDGNVVKIEILNACKFLGQFLTCIIQANPRAKPTKIG